MAKNRKTRKEKLRSTERRTPSTEAPQSIVDTPSIPTSHFTYTPTTPFATGPRTVISEQLVHLREDLQRTLVVTGAIILAEIALYMFLLTR